MTRLLNVIIRFPDRTVDEIALPEPPEIGADIDARGVRWRITSVRLPWGLDVHGDTVYDIDVDSLPTGSPNDLAA